MTTDAARYRALRRVLVATTRRDDGWTHYAFNLFGADLDEHADRLIEQQKSLPRKRRGRPLIGRAK